MNTTVVAVFFFLFLQSAFAFDSPSVLYKLSGRTNHGNEPCELQVLREYYLNNDNTVASDYRVDLNVLVAEGHGSDELESFSMTVAPSVQTPTLEAKNEELFLNLRIALPLQGDLITNARAFSFTFPHGDHLHRVVCKDLVLN